ncbi:alpha-L-fucosidase [Parabacteroides sp. OttesenSCG-928-K15]|nr:alpha-L-fucosidase [Parabacteroides sp. OttesenSCG-928-K15]
MNKPLIALLIGVFLMSCVQTEDNIPKPTPGQQAMIDRKYGMFLHFGMNTYLGKQWSNGTDPAERYTPPIDMGAKAAQWVEIAKKAGMRSIVLTTKHHEGFCLWDSKYTEHDIANVAIENKVDIVKAVSDACEKHGLAFSVYYSLWDRYEPSYKSDNKYDYILFMKNQLEELMTGYGSVSELWFDGAWDRKVDDWYLQEIYDFVKSMQPDCQISTNWTVGKRPVDMQEGDTIVYFPSDFRLWDPFLPTLNDPKIYSHNGESYYLPYECTQTMSVLGNWFHYDADMTVRDLDELEEIFYMSTINDNCLLLNLAPDRNGELNPLAITRLFELAKQLGIEDGKPFPKELNKPESLTSFATAEASSVFNSDTLHWGAVYAVDSDVSTSWKSTDTTGWLSITLEKKSLFNEILIIEGNNTIKNYSIDIKENGQWHTIHRGETLSDDNIQSFMGYGFGKIILPEPVNTQQLRIQIESAVGIPSIYSVRLKNTLYNKIS